MHLLSSLKADARLRAKVWRVVALSAAALAVLAAALWFGYNQLGKPAPGAELAKRPVSQQMVALPEPGNLPIAADAALRMNAARSFDDEIVTPARRFNTQLAGPSFDRAVGCLAAAAWFEAGDDAEGERSVVQTVLNRVRHPAFPSSICGVVFQGQERKTGCQFTFTCDGALQRTPSEEAWKRAVAISQAMLSGEVYAPIGYSTHYHTDWVVPYWSSSLAKVAKVRTHIFYRWAGFWGMQPAFTQEPQAEEPIIPAIARLSAAHSDNPLAVTTEAGQVPPNTAMVAEKPVINIPGVSLRSMNGATVRLTPNGDVFFLQLEDRSFSGNHAISALAVCKNKPTCQVYGWTDSSAIADHLPLSEAQRSKLSFYYMRKKDGSDTALWNCDQFSRKNIQQCMPSGPLPLAD